MISRKAHSISALHAMLTRQYKSLISSLCIYGADFIMFYGESWVCSARLEVFLLHFWLNNFRGHEKLSFKIIHTLNVSALCSTDYVLSLKE